MALICFTFSQFEWKLFVLLISCFSLFSFWPHASRWCQTWTVLPLCLLASLPVSFSPLATRLHCPRCPPLTAHPRSPLGSPSAPPCTFFLPLKGAPAVTCCLKPSSLPTLLLPLAPPPQPCPPPHPSLPSPLSRQPQRSYPSPRHPSSRPWTGPRFLLVTLSPNSPQKLIRRNL